MCDWGNPDPGPSHWQIMQTKEKEEKRNWRASARWPVSIRDQVRKLMADGKTRTCMQILHQLGDPCSSDSLSSSLLQMAKNHEFVIVMNFGPRGGKGYRKDG